MLDTINTSKVLNWISTKNGYLTLQCLLCNRTFKVILGSEQLTKCRCGKGCNYTFDIKDSK